MSKLFALLFTLSISVALFYAISPPKTVQKPLQEPSGTSIQQKKANSSSFSIELQDILEDNRLILYSAIGSSIFSLLGFLLSLRSTRRENQLLNLKLERESLELEKLHIELEALKRNQ